MPTSPALTRRLNAALVSLALLPPDATFDPDDDAAYTEVAGTILEELDEGCVTLSPETPIATLDIAIKRVLHSLGHPPPTDRASTLTLLCTELQLSRMHSTHTVPSPPSSDTRLASGVSRLALSLSVSADGVRDLHALRDLLSRLHNALSTRVRDAGAHALGVALCTSVPDAGRLDELRRIAGLLEEEYVLRREMLLQRLTVTVRAFARAGPSFREVLQRVCGASVQGVAVADALAARDWMLRVQPVSRSRMAGEVCGGVKDVLMGEVPDRGGRVGKAAAAVGEMPRFAARVEMGQGGRGGRKGKWKGKGKKGRKEGW